MILDLGAGRYPKHKAVTIDKTGADYNIDLEEAKLPFGDGTVEKIYAEDLLEHIKNLIPLMNECHRVMEPGGEMVISVPDCEYKDAFSDPTHVRYFTDETFKYFSEYVGTEWCNFDYGIKRWNIKQDKANHKLYVTLTK